MDVLSDDHEREEVVRKWWHENWKPIILGIVIALAGMVGYRQYQAYQLSSAQDQAYVLYQERAQLLNSGADGIAKAQAYMNENANIYGALLALDVADIQIRAARYDDADKTLEFVDRNGPKMLKDNAQLTRARLLGERGDYAGAIAAADKVSSDAYLIEREEIKGDIYLAQGDADNAYAAYRKAADAAVERKLGVDPVLQIKLDSVLKDGAVPAFKMNITQ